MAICKYSTLSLGALALLFLVSDVDGECFLGARCVICVCAYAVLPVNLYGRRDWRFADVTSGAVAFNRLTLSSLERGSHQYWCAQPLKPLCGLYSYRSTCMISLDKSLWIYGEALMSCLRRQGRLCLCLHRNSLRLLAAPQVLPGELPIALQMFLLCYQRCAACAHYHDNTEMQRRLAALLVHTTMHAA